MVWVRARAAPGCSRVVVVVVVVERACGLLACTCPHARTWPARMPCLPAPLPPPPPSTHTVPPPAFLQLSLPDLAACIVQTHPACIGSLTSQLPSPQTLRPRNPAPLRDFRHEKTKKKRGSYRGGNIDPGATFSIKFDSDDDA